MRLAVVVAWVALVVVAAPAAGETVRCPGGRVTTTGWSAPESERICAAATSALDALKEAGLSFSGSLEIRPLAGPGQDDAPQPLGRYDAGAGLVELIGYEAAVAASRAHAPAFGLPMSRELWQSFVAHELAHAVAATHFSAPAERRPAASEYIAAVVQLLAMPQALRGEILAAWDPAGFAAAEEISILPYEMNPAVFAVKSYRHYVALGDAGPAFFERLLREGLPQ